MNKKYILLLYVLLILFMCNNAYAYVDSDTILFINSWEEIGKPEYDCLGDPIEYKIKENNQNCIGDLDFYNNTICYIYDDENFSKFIESPTKDFLNESFTYVTDKTLIFKLDEDKYSNALRGTLLNDKDMYIKFRCTYFMPCIRNGWALFIKQGFETLSIDNLQNILEENNIFETIQERAIIIGRNYIPVVWIKTENSYYFAIFRDFNEDEDYNIIGAKYLLYDEATFKERFKIHSGSLIIDNKEVEGENNIIMHYDYPFVKARALLENIEGKEVIWDEDKQSFTFYIGEDEIEYFINAQDGPYMTHYKKNGEHIMDTTETWWTLFNPIIVDGQFYYKIDYLHLLLSKYGKEYKIDVDNDQVIISDINNN